MSVSIIDAMVDPYLFGATSGGSSHAAWGALLAGFYGLPLDTAEAGTFKALTGRTETPQEAANELWLEIGRRGRKSHLSALIASYEAAFQDHRGKLAAGEWATVMLMAADRAQARALKRNVRGFFEHPMLRPMVTRETANGPEFSNRCVVEVGTASFPSLRGYTLAAAMCDEITFQHSDGARPDAETIAALRPALATLGANSLLCQFHMPAVARYWIITESALASRTNGSLPYKPQAGS